MQNAEINSAINELRTLRDLLRWGMSQFNIAGVFFGHGTDNPWDEALALALHAIHLPYDANPAVLDARLTTAERHAIIELFQQRIEQRIPAPYLTHESWFAGLPFYIDQRALIPRSPMAELIEKRFVPWIDPDEVGQILDIGTGSGCIAIACAMAFPGAMVDAIDNDTDALEVAKINVSRHHVEDQVNLIVSDVFSALEGKRYDIIISNPPYVGAEEMASLPPEYLQEPKQALAAGKEGLDIALRILQAALTHLTPKGILVIEVGNTEGALQARLPNVPFLWLEFERGGGGVLLLTATQLAEYAHELK
ncbi:MAG: 50S ribosomal protein L3 N(5)-glutamine methyltransferase [Coxiellaceae bacterium]|nr:MAG: 50S ribosomal protein L3 N(5)-glutamine methyltransferase [Coxiellaceae bacterium]